MRAPTGCVCYADGLNRKICEGCRFVLQFFAPWRFFAVIEGSGRLFDREKRESLYYPPIKSWNRFARIFFVWQGTCAIPKGMALRRP